MQNESICEKNITDCASSWEPFDRMLARHNLPLRRGETAALQINVGSLCNLACKHCHLEAGPRRPEIMTAGTIKQVIAYARKNRFATLDITGGAPELNPGIENMIARLAPLTTRLMLRTNLTALPGEKWDRFIDLCREYRVVIIASLPSLNEAQTDSQRGTGTFRQSVAALKKLNAVDYGAAGSGLELDLVANPVGTSLPGAQLPMEKRFQRILSRKWGIVFNNLYSFSNAPLGRWRCRLERQGILAAYRKKLQSRFNPGSVSSVMCRSMISVDWQGYLYDCDFNLAANIYLGGRKIHITEMAGIPEAGSPIMVADHCYACTAGTGFS